MDLGQPGRLARSARLALLGAAALFSTGGAAIKSCSWSSWQVAGLRSGIAALAFLLLVPAARRLPGARELLVGTGYAATLILFVLATKLSTAANAIFLQSTAPLYILLLSPWLLHERIRRRDVLVLLVIAAGLALFFLDGGEPLATAPDPLLGNLLALASGLCWALTVVGLRWLSTTAPGGGTGTIVTGNALAFVVSLFFAAPFAPGTTQDWLLIGYLGVFQIALAYLLVTRALRHVPAFEASLWLLVEPVLNPLWAFLVHGERPGAWSLCGGALILGATALQSSFGARAPAQS
jgi:drug/metabolite transporter (DMT)-like permease